MVWAMTSICRGLLSRCLLRHISMFAWYAMVTPVVLGVGRLLSVELAVMRGVAIMVVIVVAVVIACQGLHDHFGGR